MTYARGSLYGEISSDAVVTILDETKNLDEIAREDIVGIAITEIAANVSGAGIACGRTGIAIRTESANHEETSGARRRTGVIVAGPASPQSQGTSEVDENEANAAMGGGIARPQILRNLCLT